MAVAAFTESEPDIARLIVRTRRVTFLACNLRVLSGQGILGFRVIELRDVLPILEVVTLLAVGSETCVVFVFVARRTSRGNAEEGAVTISHLNAESF